MRIELISKKQHTFLKTLQKEHPKLTFQNEGYEYIKDKDLSEEDVKARKQIETILKEHVVDFVRFNNFKFSKKEMKLQIRLQYKYGRGFTGVGYILLDELLNGFE